MVREKEESEAGSGAGASAGATSSAAAFPSASDFDKATEVLVSMDSPEAFTALIQKFHLLCKDSSYASAVIKKIKASTVDIDGKLLAAFTTGISIGFLHGTAAAATGALGDGNDGYLDGFDPDDAL